jgi:hypothetical protein
MKMCLFDPVLTGLIGLTDSDWVRLTATGCDWVGLDFGSATVPVAPHGVLPCGPVRVVSATDPLALPILRGRGRRQPRVSKDRHF